MEDNQSTETTSQSTSNVVFVGSLAWATTDETLRKHFEDAGLQIGEDETRVDDRTGRERTIKAVTVARYPDTKKSKGYGFVTLASVEEAEKAVNQLNDSVLDGRNIRVQPKEVRPAGERRFNDRGSRGGYNNRGGNRDYNRGGYNNEDSYADAA